MSDLLAFIHIFANNSNTNLLLNNSIMKRTLLFLLVLIMANLAVIAQQVPRDNVVIEIGTATW